MKEGWTYRSFVDCINKIPKQRQVKSKDYLPSGLFPIVSQEKELISGYWNDEEYLYKHDKPIIVFGDHTKEIKYIDFDFVVGADGTQILCPKDDIDTKFFYYALLATPIRTLGYARHFKLLKEKSFFIPRISEQKRIVERLDAAFAHIDELKANAEKQLTEARALFHKCFAKAMEPKQGWEEKKLGDVCEIKSLLVDPTEEQYKKLLHVGGANIVSLTGELVDLKTAEDEQLTSGKFTFDENDVLYNKIRPYLIKVSRPEFSGLCSADMYPLTPKGSITKGYLYYILISKDFTEYAILNSGRAGMPKVNRQALFAYKCSIPPIKEQQRIVARLDSLSENIRKYEEIQRKVISECDALKQALLRKVFE